MQSPLSSVPLELIPIDLVLWIGLLVAVVAFGIFSALLLWHWKEYSTGRFTTVANMFVYLGVGAGLLAIMGLCAAWYGA